MGVKYVRPLDDPMITTRHNAAFSPPVLTGINARRRDEFISGGSAIPGT
jgi:hypothetical protein